MTRDFRNILIVLFSFCHGITYSQCDTFLAAPFSVKDIHVTDKLEGNCEKYTVNSPLNRLVCSTSIVTKGIVRFGGGWQQDSFTYTVEFSKPIQKFDFILEYLGFDKRNATNLVERVYFNTDCGNLQITENYSCDLKIDDNSIIGYNSAKDFCNQGSGHFSISANNCFFDAIEISGNGKMGGSNFYICGSSIMSIEDLTSFSTQDFKICPNDSVVVNSHTYKLPGIYQHTIKNHLNADSIITINLDLLKSSFDTQYVQLCEGSSYQVDQNTYFLPGIYIDSLKNYLGCDSILKTILTVAENSFLEKKYNLCPNDSILIANNSYNYPGSYSDTLQNSLGCDSIINFTITQINNSTCDNFRVYIPNAFTPNSDKINNYFGPVCTNVAKIKMLIYNRWGEKLFETNSLLGRWDGTYLNKYCPAGIYFYIIEVSGINGKKEHYDGLVNLLR